MAISTTIPDLKRYISLLNHEEKNTQDAQSKFSKRERKMMAAMSLVTGLVSAALFLCQHDSIEFSQLVTALFITFSFTSLTFIFLFLIVCFIEYISGSYEPFVKLNTTQKKDLIEFISHKQSQDDIVTYLDSVPTQEAEQLKLHLQLSFRENDYQSAVEHLKTSLFSKNQHVEESFTEHVHETHHLKEKIISAL